MKNVPLLLTTDPPCLTLNPCGLQGSNPYAFPPKPTDALSIFEDSQLSLQGELLYTAKRKKEKKRLVIHLFLFVFD